MTFKLSWFATASEMGTLTDLEQIGAHVLNEINLCRGGGGIWVYRRGGLASAFH